MEDFLITGAPVLVLLVTVVGLFVWAAFSKDPYKK